MTALLNKFLEEFYNKLETAADFGIFEFGSDNQVSKKDNFQGKINKT